MKKSRFSRTALFVLQKIGLTFILQNRDCGINVASLGWKLYKKKGERKMDATYKTVVIDYAPKAKKMAAAIEDKANEMAREGWEPVTFSVTNSAKAILMFRVPDAVKEGKGNENG